MKPVGVILSGGKSSRMGSPKHLISYHQQPHWIYIGNLLQTICSEVVVSTGDLPSDLFPNSPYQLIPDHSTNRGPMAGLAAVISLFPGRDIIISACDFPNIEQATFNQLIQMKTSVCFETNGYPEPWLSFYKADFCTHISHQFDRGEDSLIKLIRAEKIALITPQKSEWLINRNSP